MTEKIRRVRLSDLDNLMKLLFQLHKKKEADEKISRKRLSVVLKKMLNDKNLFLAVYQDSGGLAGTATLFIHTNLTSEGKSRGCIENVVIDKNSRGKGIGKKLVTYLIDEAKKRDCYRVFLDCTKQNIRFYEKCGMIRCPVRDVEMIKDLEQ